jgi:hypothetical protein
MARYFRLEQAQALIPEIEPLIRQAVTLKGSYEKSESDLRAASQRIAMLGGAQVDRSQLLSLRSRMDASGARLKELLEEIQGYGCLVKDLDSGLLDFPTLYRGEEVYLCWRLDEPDIQYWHPVQDGFQGRKLIDQEFLDNHEGDIMH